LTPSPASDADAAGEGVTILAAGGLKQPRPFLYPSGLLGLFGPILGEYVGAPECMDNQCRRILQLSELLGHNAILWKLT
jgi:hypothetical protein